MGEFEMQPTITGPTIECRQCGKSNSLDSRFCRSCGAAMPAEDLAAARERHQELLDEGARLLAEGREDEARLAAEAAIEADPESPRAHAFLGDCLEQADDIAGALAEYERVVQLAPDSALDKIRVAHLRKMLGARSLEVQPAPDRRRALLGGTLAMIVVGSLGTVLAILNASGGADQLPAAGHAPVTSPQTQLQPNQPEAQGAQQTPQTSQPPGGAEVAGADGAQQAAAREPAQNEGAVPAVPRGGGSVLPLPRPDGSVARVGGTAPLVPPIEGNIRVTPEAPTKAGVATAPPVRSTDPDPTPVAPAPDTRKPPANPGIIEITPSKGQNRPRVGGSEPIEQGRAETLVRVARQQYLMGNYAAAADAYVKALAGGAEPGITNQRLAQSYERLGRRSEAAAAYARAIRVFESEPSLSPSRKAALAACKQAARVAGG